MQLQIWIYSLASVFAVSLMSLLGVITLYISSTKLDKLLHYLISFAAGALIGDALIHLLPEIVEQYSFTLNISIYVLLGLIASFIIEKIIHWRHCHHPTSEDHPHPFAWVNLVGDAVHNFIDGIIIAAAYLVSIPLGIATTTAVIFHEVPQEIGDFSVLVHGGFSKAKALLMNFITALAAVLGTVIALSLGAFSESLIIFFIPFAAGIFIYISCADLIPELHKEQNIKKSILQLLAFILGIALMAVLILPIFELAPGSA